MQFDFGRPEEKNFRGNNPVVLKMRAGKIAFPNPAIIEKLHHENVAAVGWFFISCALGINAHV
jgi:hypothetical protein